MHKRNKEKAYADFSQRPNQTLNGSIRNDVIFIDSHEVTAMVTLSYTTPLGVANSDSLYPLKKSKAKEF